MDVFFVPCRELGEEIDDDNTAVLYDGNPPPNRMKHVNRIRHVTVHESAATIMEVRSDLLPLRAPRLLPIPPERAVAPSIPRPMMIFLISAGFRLLLGEKGEKIGEKVGKWWCSSEE